MNRFALTDPASPVFGVTSAAVIGSLSLIDPSKLDEQQTRAMRVLSAAVSGLYIGVTMGGKRPPLKFLVGVASGLGALRLSEVSESVDRWMESRIRQAGARNPRPWIAGGAAAFIFAGFLMDRASAKGQQLISLFDEQPEQVRPLDPRLRGLVGGILCATDMPGTSELRAQLEGAQEVYWVDEFTGTAQFKVSDGLPRTVPHNQVFPVRARFVGPSGSPQQVLLQIFEGKIDHLAVESVDQDAPDSIDELIEEWPDADSVVFVLDGPNGMSNPIS